jgi:hypothetical protein
MRRKMLGTLTNGRISGDRRDLRAQLSDSSYAQKQKRRAYSIGGKRESINDMYTY